MDPKPQFLSSLPQSASIRPRDCFIHLGGWLLVDEINQVRCQNVHLNGIMATEYGVSWNGGTPQMDGSQRKIPTKNSDDFGVALF